MSASNMARYSTRFRSLRRRAGYTSLRALAVDCGYRNASSLQRYESPEFDADPIPARVVRRIAPYLIGKGSPPIGNDEVWRLAGLPTAYDPVTTFSEAIAVLNELRRLDMHAMPDTVIRTAAHVIALRADPTYPTRSTVAVADEIVRNAFRPAVVTESDPSNRSDDDPSRR